MPTLEDALAAARVLEELSHDEQAFLTRFLEKPLTLSPSEIASHMKTIRVLLDAQTALITLAVNQLGDFDKQIAVILTKLETIQNNQ